MVLAELPTWLVDGILLGLVAASGVLIVYLVGLRWLDLGTDRSRHHDPDGLRRTEVRAYLAAIGEPAEEGTTIGGVKVDFWLPDRDVAITFDAADYFGLVEAGVTAVLLEHEVPGHRIGARLPFETPSVDDWTPSTASDDAWARDRLGVGAEADEAAIRRAYRERIVEVHPDHGGDVDAFIDVVEAYEHLTDGGNSH